MNSLQASDVISRPALFVVTDEDHRLIRLTAVAELPARIGGVDGVPECGEQFRVGNLALNVGNPTALTSDNPDFSDLNWILPGPGGR